MTDLSTLQNKISSVKKYLTVCRGFSDYTREEIEKDIMIRGTVERYLYLAAQSTIDLAETFIAFKKFRKPTTMSESFHILEENGVIDHDLTKKMVNLTGFRNIMAHDYENVDYGIVYGVLHNGLKDIEQLVSRLE